MTAHKFLFLLLKFFGLTLKCGKNGFSDITYEERVLRTDSLLHYDRLIDSGNSVYAEQRIVEVALFAIVSAVPFHSISPKQNLSYQSYKNSRLPGYCVAQTIDVMHPVVTIYDHS